MDSIQVCESDLGVVWYTQVLPKRPPKRMRRMSHRQVKKYVARRIKETWDAAKIELVG